ncbi:Nucleoside diphosphate kinase II, chloroplastic [Nowakowskiella sp. JEL0078]|nr:Nucleoside diphosphate kinase II, chloroplastic [Nowakowskiella sp. JEL0078]
MSFPSERTYIMVKPDGVERGLVGEIIKRFESKGYRLIGLKIVSPPRFLLEKHYSDLAGKKFFPGLINYMSSGPVVSMVWQGKEVVKTGRKLLGATNPLESAPGTIRGDFCIDVGKNLIHGSDSVENAEKEIALVSPFLLLDYRFTKDKTSIPQWFPEGVVSYERYVDKLIYETD